MIAATVWAVLVYREDTPESIEVGQVPVEVSPTTLPTTTVTLPPQGSDGEPIESVAGGEEEVDVNLNPSPSIATPTPTITLGPTAVVTIGPSLTPTETPVQSFVVRGFEYAYNPAVIRVEAGSTVQIEFRNTGEVAHNLVIDELGVQSGELQPGEVKLVELTIPVNGPSEYTYYCSLGNHRALGMEGRIEVVQ